MYKVLVVDDEIDICLLVTKQLQSMGFEAAYALSIKDALQKTNSTLYNLFFIDLNLTDGSGYDLLQSLKELQSNSKVVIISAYDNEERKAIEKGASLFLAKPFTKKSISESLIKLNFPII